MSYRTYVNSTQIFGNNECYKEWLDYLKNKGFEISPDGCYEGYLDNFMEPLEIIESIVMGLEVKRKEKYNRLADSFDKNSKDISCKQMLESMRLIAGTHSIFDFSSISDYISTQKDTKAKNICNAYNTSLFDELRDILDNAYAMMPVAFHNACADVLEQENPYSYPGHLYCYKLKPGQRLHVKAY